MLIECTNCGAPLDVAQGKRRTKCGYCGRPQQVRSARTLALERPAGWQPPAQWTPPANFPAASQPMSFDAKAARGLGQRIALTVLVSTLLLGLLPLVIIGFVFWKVEQVVETTVDQVQGGMPVVAIPGGSVSTGSSTVTTEPLTCIGASHLIRMNETLRVTGPIAVIVRDGCHLTLNNGTISGTDGIEVQTGGRLEMVNGTIDATGTALRVADDADVTLTNVIIDAQIGIDASGNATVRMVNGRLNTRATAIAARDQADVITQNVTHTGEVLREDAATVLVDGSEAP